MIWAAGVLQLDSKEVNGTVSMLCDEATLKLQRFTPLELAMTCRALALRGVRNETLMAGFANAVLQKARAWREQDVSVRLPQVLWAHARMGINNEALLELVSEVLTPSLDRLTDASLSMLVWSYVKLDTDGAFAEFRRLLVAKALQRGLDAKAVRRARFGHEEWGASEESA
eukprot:CAMPEP_0204569514 /NCGR_PEP_ID=MMETSP0661-20131031/37786_1 /ASSEMBLY_ACC=CAM_ASM_000606 /TAXON_ID=109239 /ORGANISM="Alexandrium margalefi, Strain AMGDE01CS-322" /LENGTH=170 /DNA_ID=CAMNT_0051577619 /DNA_START=83 /DNA_END=595 /DNA_ORIENTATION=-